MSVSSDAKRQRSTDAIESSVEQNLSRVAQGGRIQIYSENSEFTKRRKAYRLVTDAYNADNGYLTGANITPFSAKESPERLKVRQQNAYYFPLVRLLANYIVNSAHGVNITRNFKDAFGVDFTKLKGVRGSWEETFRYAMTRSIITGSTLVGVDRKMGSPLRTYADELKNPLVPTVLPVLAVPDWSLYGDDIEWLKICGMMPDKGGNGTDPFHPKSTDQTVKILTKTNFKIYQQENGIWRIKRRGVNEIDQVPFVIASSERVDDPSSWYGATDFIQVAKATQRLYDLLSEMDDQLRSTAFNMLAMAIENDDDAKTLAVGSDTIFGYKKSAGAEKPEYLAPDPSPVRICMEQFDMLVALCFQIARLGGVNSSRKPATAVQKIFENEEAEKAIRRYCKMMEETERGVIRICLKFMGKDPVDYEEQLHNPKVLHWPQKFDLNVLRENYAAIALQLLSIKWKSERCQRYYQQYFSKTLVPASNEEQAAWDEEFEAAKFDTEDKRFSDPGQAQGANLRRPITEHNAMAPGTNNQEDATTNNVDAIA